MSQQSRAANRSRRHAPLISSETASWRRYWRAACWLMSELEELAKRDPAQAREWAEDLTKQTQQFAERLNALASQEGGS